MLREDHQSGRCGAHAVAPSEARPVRLVSNPTPTWTARRAAYSFLGASGRAGVQPYANLDVAARAARPPSPLPPMGGRARTAHQRAAASARPLPLEHAPPACQSFV